jgi:hypothetical protein
VHEIQAASNRIVTHMPRDTRPQPRWIREADAEIDDTVGGFKSDLKTIALRMAKSERSECVVARHVHEAFQSLARSGLSRVPWLKRRETEASAGGSIFGLAFSLPDVMSASPGTSDWKAQMCFVAVVLTAVFGASLMLHSAFRSH